MIVIASGIGAGFQNLGVFGKPIVSKLGYVLNYSIVGTTVNSTGVTQCNKSLATSSAAVAISGMSVLGNLEVGTTNALLVVGEVSAAYYAYQAMTPTGECVGDLGGRTFTPGVYSTASAINITSLLILDALGDTTAQFVFQTDAAFSPSSGAVIQLRNGATADNVYWICTGAPSTGGNCFLVGNILSVAAITIGQGSTLYGRALSFGGAVTLASNIIVS
jgi:hypothetical protein